MTLATDPPRKLWIEEPVQPAGDVVLDGGKTAREDCPGDFAGAVDDDDDGNGDTVIQVE